MMEKRKKNRVDSENMLHLFLEDQDQVVRQGMGKTLNMSEIGLLIETGFPLCPGDRASIEIGLGEDIVHVDGEIVRVDTGENGKSEAGIALSEPELRIGEKIEKETGTAAERNAAYPSEYFTKGKRTMSQSLFESNFEDLKLIKRGKVRDLYDLGDSLLLVATDRISAFDVVLPDPIPDKGKILTQISLFWFDMMKPLIANHLISSEVDDYPAACRPYAEMLRGRSMLVKKASPLTIECVARGYISGSGWKSYRESGSICGISLPAGLRESDQLPEPIFTPATKEEIGFHDINIDFEEAAKRVGRKIAEKVKDLTLQIYRKGAEYAETKGIIIADTKFEFGMVNGDLIMIDEALTPDSSRFWPKAEYSPGGPQPSFDKQYLRDYLVSIKWDKNPPAPSLPEDIIRETRGKYLEALEKLTGRSL